jgi:myo-inositol-1(or 4)-monophosphatase
VDIPDRRAEDRRDSGEPAYAVALPLAISAAQLGGEVLRRYFRKLDARQVSEKTKNDLVTAADRASEAAIVGFLRSRCPGWGFLAEEGGASGASGVRWVLDPLDGTLNFVQGFPHFAVSLALVADGQIEVGVIYDPMRDEVYAASRGGGATCNGAPISVSGRACLDGAFVTTGFAFRIAPILDTYLNVFRDVFCRAAAVRRPGAAALDLAHTASGVFDAFFELGLAPWDAAAGVLIVREAGGVVTNLQGGLDVLSHGNVVAGTPGVHGELLPIAATYTSRAGIGP